MMTKRENSNIDALLGLKAICCMMIVVFHTFKPTSDNLQSVVSFIHEYFGAAGNIFFFMMSGFLMGYFYRNRIQKLQVSFGDYLVKKLIKIHPLFVITNIIGLIVTVIINGNEEYTLNRLITTLLMANGGTLENYSLYNYPSWFACVVLVCYILYFFIAYLSRDNNTKYFVGIVGMIIVGYTICAHPVSFPFIYKESGMGYQNFFIGCLLSEIYKKTKQSKKVMVGTAVSLFFVLLLIFIDDRGFGEFCGGWTNVVSFCLAPLLIYIALTNMFVNKAFRLLPLQAFGKISVSMFYWHAVLSFICYSTIRQHIVERFPYMFYYFLLIIILIAFSVLSYHLVEKKFSKVLFEIYGDNKNAREC